MEKRQLYEIVSQLIVSLTAGSILLFISEGLAKFLLIGIFLIILIILIIKKFQSMKKILNLLVLGLLIIFIIFEGSKLLLRLFSQAEPIKIGLVNWTGVAPFFVAQEKNYFEDVKVDFEIIEGMGRRRYLMFTNKIQAFQTTIDMFQCCPRIASPSPGVICWALDKFIGGDAIVSHSDTNKLKIQNNQLVTGAEFGDATHYLLLKFLDKIRIPIFKTDFKSLSLEQVNRHFLKGKLHIAGISEPRLSDLLKLDKSTKIIYSSADLPDDFSIIDVLVIDEKSLNERKNDWIKIYKGWCKALKYIKEEPDRACQIMANYMKVDHSVIKNGLNRMILYGDEENRQLFNFENDNSIDKIFRNIGQYLKSKDLNHEMFSPAEKITRDIIFANE